MVRLFGGIVAAVLIYLVWIWIAGGGGNLQLAATGWTRSANYTTCDQWATQMTPDQRAAMASELLPILRRTVDSAADAGSALVPAFVDAITVTCRSSSVAQYVAISKQPYVITAAAALAFTESKQFQP